MNNPKRKKIYLSPPNLNGEEIEYIKDAISSNWIAPLGPHVDAFEKETSDYIGIKHAVALSSGTASLHLALKILGVNKDDFVFCSDLTFVASANAIRYLDAIPIFIDSESESWNMCPKALEKAFQLYKPKAVVVTDLYGQSARYDELIRICNLYNSPIIEDAAESLGAEYNEKKCGVFGEMSILSFNGNKIITTSGGGMLMSNNKKYIDEARMLSSQAREKALHYEHLKIGYNYRMSNILAGIGRAQLKSIDDYVKKKNDIFNYYRNELSSFNQIVWMPELENSKSTKWLSVLYFIDLNHDDIESLVKIFIKNNIEARPLWKPMHLQPIYNNSEFIKLHSGRGLSTQLFQQGLCLPSGINLKIKDQDRIVKIIKTFLQK